MQHTFFNYVYVGSLILGVVSLALWAGLRGTAPLGIRAGVADGTLVLSYESDRSPLGTKSVFHSNDYASPASVVVRVDGMLRKDGELYYYTARPSGEIVATQPARALVGGWLFSVPLLGYLALFLSHPVGLMACVGMPFIMLVVHLVQIAIVQPLVRMYVHVRGRVSAHSLRAS